MAGQYVFINMVGERDRAASAGKHVAAVTALNKGGSSSPVKEQNHLLFISRGGGNGLG